MRSLLALAPTMGTVPGLYPCRERWSLLAL